MDTPRGLSQIEATRGLIDAGPNELPSARLRTLRALVLEVMREPMLFLLVLDLRLMHIVPGRRQEGTL